MLKFTEGVTEQLIRILSENLTDEETVKKLKELGYLIRKVPMGIGAGRVKGTMKVMPKEIRVQVTKSSGKNNYAKAAIFEATAGKWIYEHIFLYGKEKAHTKGDLKQAFDAGKSGMNFYEWYYSFG